MQKTINIITLGCAKNIVDSEHLAGRLGDTWKITFDSDDPAHVVCINTCGFILDAKEESINTILHAAQLRREGKIKELYVFGCLSERYKDELREEIPEVDQFFGARTIEDIVDQLRADDNKIARKLSTPHHYAYLKISEGCNWGCGYCAIPLIRGKHRSVPFEQLIAEAQMLAHSGVKELIVIAQDTTYYGIDLYGRRRLGELLRALCQIPELQWLRLHYAYPAQFPEDVLDAMRDEPKICNYLDIPLQHVSDNMLQSMRRGLNKTETIALVDMLRSKVPDIAIRTTMLVGYPGETWEDFEELCDFVRKSRFERLGVFPYSEEEGTYSATELRDDVAQSIKDARVEQLMLLQRELSQALNAGIVGRTIRVIIDRQEGDYYVGRSQWDSPEVDGELLITSDHPLQAGAMVNVLVTAAEEYDLYATVCD